MGSPSAQPALPPRSKPVRRQVHHEFPATGRSLERWIGLTRFIENPRIPRDNNAAERALRGPVVGRKNHYGSRSQRGTQVAALFYTLCETAKLAGVDPHVYLLRALHAAIARPGAITYAEDLLTTQPA